MGHRRIVDIILKRFKLGVMTFAGCFAFGEITGRSMLSPGNWRLSGDIVCIRVSLRPNRKE